MRVLEALAKHPKPQSLKAVAEAADLPASQVHRYLASYVRTGMVAQDTATGLYDLGPAALRVGLAALERLDAHAVGFEALERLGDTIDRTCFLSVWSENGPLIVNWYRGSRPLMTSLGIGSRLPIIGSATGHVFLSFNSPALTTQLVAPDDVAEAARVRERVRRDGFERIHETLIPGLHAVSAPILDHQDEAAVTLTVLMRAADADASEPDVLPALRDAAASASSRLGSTSATA